MLAPWKESYDQPRQHITKQRHYFTNKGMPSQSYGFSSSHVWMWELNQKKDERQRIDGFWTVVLEKTLESPWTARRSNQSILKEIGPEYSLEGLMLKLQYFGHLMRRADSLEKTLMLGKIRWEEKGTTEDKIVGWHHQLNGHEFEETLGVGDAQEGLVCCDHGVAKSQTWLSDLFSCLIILNLGTFPGYAQYPWLSFLPTQILSSFPVLVVNGLRVLFYANLIKSLFKTCSSSLLSSG